jgi:hypothetical protein
VKFLAKNIQGYIRINGTDFNGQTLAINEDNIVSINNTELDINTLTSVSDEISIEIHGNVGDINTNSAPVSARNVGRIQSTSGNVSCLDVMNNITTMSGDVTCNMVDGDVRTVSGYIMKTSSNNTALLEVTKDTSLPLFKLGVMFGISAACIAISVYDTFLGAIFIG